MINKYSITYSTFYYSKLDKEIKELIVAITREKKSEYFGSSKRIFKRIWMTKNLKKAYSFTYRDKLIVLDTSNPKDFIIVQENGISWPIVNPDKIYYGVIK